MNIIKYYNLLVEYFEVAGAKKELRKLLNLIEEDESKAVVYCVYRGIKADDVKAMKEVIEKILED